VGADRGGCLIQLAPSSLLLTTSGQRVRDICLAHSQLRKPPAAMPSIMALRTSISSSSAVIIPRRGCKLLRRMQDFKVHAVPFPALTCCTGKCPIRKQRQRVHFIERRRKPRNG